MAIKRTPGPKRHEEKKSIRSIPVSTPTQTKRDDETELASTRAAREHSVPPSVPASTEQSAPKAELKAKDAETVKDAEPLVRTATRSIPRSPVEDHKNRQ